MREPQPLPHVPDLAEALDPEPLREPSAGARHVQNSIPSGGEEHAGTTHESSTEPVDHASPEPDGDALARHELPPTTAPQQYKMQFSTSEEHVRLVERAKTLLARTAPGCSLGELHQQAMQLLVARLEEEKFAVTERQPSAQPQPAPTESSVASKKHELRPEQRTKAPRQRVRHVPAAVKREVFVRDAGCCKYVDERGERCREMRYLELHHLQPSAHGGQHVATNLALRCAAHNALAAEEDFGRASIEHKRLAARHDSLTAQSCPSAHEGPAALGRAVAGAQQDDRPEPQPPDTCNRAIAAS